MRNASRDRIWYSHAISNTPTIFTQLIEIAEKGFQNEQNTLDETFRKIIDEDQANSGNNELSLKINQWLWDYSKDRVKIFVPSLFRESVFLTIYAFLEDILAQVCTHLYASKSLSLQPNDLRGRGIERSRIYLKKIVGINFPDQPESKWDILISYSRLRNNIVHNFAGIDLANNSKSGDLLLKFIRTQGTLGIAGNRIYIDKGFLPEVNKVVETFLILLKDRLCEYDKDWEDVKEKTPRPIP
jgi:hypothetical protein